MNRTDVVVYATRRLLTAVQESVARFARNQTASQDSGGQAEKRTSFDLAHKLPLQRVPASGECATPFPWAVMWEGDEARVE